MSKVLACSPCNNGHTSHDAVVTVGAFSQYRRSFGNKWTRVDNCKKKDKKPIYAGSRKVNGVVIHESAYQSGRGDPVDVPEPGDDCIACGRNIVVEGKGILLAQSRNGRTFHPSKSPWDTFWRSPDHGSDRQKRTYQNRKFLKIKSKTLF
jgi:hypothetical protein